MSRLGRLACGYGGKCPAVGCFRTGVMEWPLLRTLLVLEPVHDPAWAVESLARRRAPIAPSIPAGRIAPHVLEGGHVEKMAITVDAEVCDALHRVIGRRRISRFLNERAKPYVLGVDRSAGYAALAADSAREAEAEAWSEGLITDVAGAKAQHG